MKTPNQVPLGVKGRHQPIRSNARSRFSLDDNDWEMVTDEDIVTSSDEDPDWDRSKRKPTRRVASIKRCQPKKNQPRKPRLASSRPCPPVYQPSDAGQTGQGKLLMRPWLIQQVDKGEVQGLEWIDSTRTKVRIPWMHGSSQKWKKEEGILFIKWAEYSRKHSTNRPGDNKRWKANFRCALNSLPDVRELSHLSQNKGANAFKIYEFLEAQPRRSEIRRQEKLGLKIEGVTKTQQRRKSVKTETPPVLDEDTKDKIRHLVTSHEASQSTTLADNTRILPHPSLPEPTKYRAHSPQLPDTPPVSPDHSYAHSTPSPRPIHYYPFSNDSIPTVVENISQEECVETTPCPQVLPPFRVLGEMTALERVCMHNSTFMSYLSTSQSDNSAQDDDSCLSDISDASSPISDITEEDIKELITEIETCKNPEVLLNSMTSQAEDNTPTDTEPNVQIQYLSLLNPNGVLQPTAIIEESLHNEGQSYTTMGCH